MADMFRELTDRDHDRMPSYPNVAWRGFAYLDRIVPVLPEPEGFGEDVRDGQRCWVGYVPSTDEFLVGYDLWLRATTDGDSAMAGGFATVRLSIAGTELAVEVKARERFPHSIYNGDTLDVIEARYPDLVEIDID